MKFPCILKFSIHSLCKNHFHLAAALVNIYNMSVKFGYKDFFKHTLLTVILKFPISTDSYSLVTFPNGHGAFI